MVIANRVMEYLDSEGVEVEGRAAVAAMNACGQSLVRNIGKREEEERKPKMPRPSSSWACGRQMVFNSLGLPTDGYGWRSRMTFCHGDMTEAMGVLMYKQALRARGESDYMVTPYADGTQLEIEADIDPAKWQVKGDPFRLKAHLDMTIIGPTGEEEVADWKAINRYTFQDMVAAATDPAHKWWKKEEGGYIAQVRWYMIMLRVAGRSTSSTGYLVVVCKDTGHVCEIQVSTDHEAEKLLIRKAVAVNRWIADANRWNFEALGGAEPDEASDKLIEAQVRIAVPRAGFTAGMKIDRPGKVLRPDGTKGPCKELLTSGRDADVQAFRCSYCDHTARCWPGFEVVALSSGPVWRTNETVKPEVTVHVGGN